MIQTSLVRIDLRIVFKLEPFILGSGKAASETVWAFKYGLMELVTKVNGVKTGLTVRVNLPMLMVTCMTGTGRMTKQTEQEFISTLMELSTKECGKMTYSMAKV